MEGDEDLEAEASAVEGRLEQGESDAGSTAGEEAINRDTAEGDRIALLTTIMQQHHDEEDEQGFQSECLSATACPFARWFVPQDCAALDRAPALNAMFANKFFQTIDPSKTLSVSS
ncbi:uncharacterized protein LTR77_001976 [Saxophila tyrrhenica]|uniref:Uncharacterized protein n=1 Tax=Saxophila tyrrhenica TaxID=1690608 RepID=A0AAV9PKS9_9PEZI|nr:hypothetical protein LTR77_001976 [Saxophila tyrrhenica]